MKPQLKLIGHDLPPFWDGEKVRWEPWSDGGRIIICPPPRIEETACDQCGVIDQSKKLICSGMRLDQGVKNYREKRRLPAGKTYWHTTMLPPAWIRDLVAFRCHHCGHDRVWDQRTDEWWDLDESDYSDDGSHNPTPTLF